MPLPETFYVSVHACRKAKETLASTYMLYITPEGFPAFLYTMARVLRPGWA